MVIDVKLKYTRSNVYKSIDYIKKYADNLENIERNDIFLTTSGTYVEDECIQLTIPFSEHLTEKLDIIFCDDYFDPEYIGHRKNIMLYWEKIEEDQRHWELNIGGIIPCKRFNEVIEDKTNFNNCPCPKEFIKTCSDLISIIKNFSTDE